MCWAVFHRHRPTWKWCRFSRINTSHTVPDKVRIGLKLIQWQHSQVNRHSKSSELCVWPWIGPTLPRIIVIHNVVTNPEMSFYIESRQWSRRYVIPTSPTERSARDITHTPYFSWSDHYSNPEHCSAITNSAQTDLEPGLRTLCQTSLWTSISKTP
jgi:hypothetical protein